jgi:transposase
MHPADQILLAIHYKRVPIFILITNITCIKPAYLAKDQIKKLEQELLKGAYAHGYSEDYWTLDRIGRVIWDLYQVRYTPSGVWRLLDGMGWSCQKVQRLAIQRKDETIRNWKRWVWPKIKKSGEI